MLTETNSTKTNHNFYAGFSPTCFVSKALQLSFTQASIWGCSGIDLPFSEWQSWRKEVGCSQRWGDKGVGGHCSPEVSCRWVEQPRTWTRGSPRPFHYLLRFSGCVTPVLRSSQGNTQPWFLISLLTPQLFSPARSASTVAFSQCYLDMSLFQQRFIAVGWWVRNDDSIVLTFSSKTFIQKNTGKDKS